MGIWILKMKVVEDICSNDNHRVNIRVEENKIQRVREKSMTISQDFNNIELSPETFHGQ